MARAKLDGLRMHCPRCSTDTIYKGVSPSKLGLGHNRPWSFTDHGDIHWFRRGRHCKSCSYTFATSEVDEDYLDGICELRDALAAIKDNAEQNVRESKAASKSLLKLSESLNVLRALEVYQATNTSEASIGDEVLPDDLLLDELPDLNDLI